MKIILLAVIIIVEIKIALKVHEKEWYKTALAMWYLVGFSCAFFIASI